MIASPFPDQALELLARAFPGQGVSELAPAQGGFSHHSALASIGRRRCFVKAAELPAKRASLRHEAAALGALAGRGLAAPQLLALLDEHSWTIEVMAALPGASGVLLYAEPPGVAMAALSGLASLLAATHVLDVPAPNPDALHAARGARALDALTDLSLPSALRVALTASLEHPVWRPGTTQMSHGDAGLHNLIWGGGYALVDWEWAGWGEPLLDLAWVWWTLRWRGAPPERWAGFLAAYRAARPIEEPDPDSLYALALGQIAGILARVRDEPAAYAEWLRRAEWTLGLAPV